MTWFADDNQYLQDMLPSMDVSLQSIIEKYSRRSIEDHINDMINARPIKYEKPPRKRNAPKRKLSKSTIAELNRLVETVKINSPRSEEQKKSAQDAFLKRLNEPVYEFRYGLKKRLGE